ncbi:MAG TPA: endo-1,4-beta-xylanase [Tepidisphaeraceae bacterium]|nr:endo-1,4-beta-xylanase [Tepidisphaeraceae bacterium]
MRFEIYRQGKRVDDFRPVAAYVVGPESVPIPGEISLDDGYLVVGRSDEIPLGVSLLWDAGTVGAYHLETARLQPRQRSYVLNVELARLRLMKIMQKMEDWSLFDFPKGERFLQRFKEIQNAFAEALALLDQPAAASQIADDVLAQGITFSDELTMFHTEMLISRRRQTNTFVKHIFGCRVDCTVQNQKYREVLTNSFDYSVLPMPWKLLQPQEGTFDTTVIDGWAETLSKKRLPLIAGPLVNLDENDLPDWMFIWENDFDTVRELCYEHVQRLVQRYRKVVSLWNVASGLCTNNAFTLSFEQMIELTRLLVAQVKNILPSARTLVSISQPFGEYHAQNPSSISPVLYAEMVAQAGINFDGFALQLEMGVPLPGMFMRDLFQISCLLDKFSALGRPVFITACCVPGRSTPDPVDSSEGRLDPNSAGRWRRPWDPQLQADWMEAVYHIALSKPFVESVAWGNLVDVNQSVPGGGLMNDMFQPKPAFERLLQMRDKFQQWQKGRF